MAKKKGDAAGGEESKGSRKKLVMAVGLLLAAVFAAKTLGLVGAKAPLAVEASAEAATTPTTLAPGPIVALEPITLNTADGHYLKLGLAFQLSAAAGAAGGGHGGADDPKAAWAEALDLAIEVMGGRTYDDLVVPAGRATAKHELEERLVEAYHEEVARVFLTEFVLQ